MRLGVIPEVSPQTLIVFSYRAGRKQTRCTEKSPSSDLAGRGWLVCCWDPALIVECRRLANLGDEVGLLQV